VDPRRTRETALPSHPQPSGDQVAAGHFPQFRVLRSSSFAISKQRHVVNIRGHAGHVKIERNRLIHQHIARTQLAQAIAPLDSLAIATMNWRVPIGSRPHSTTVGEQLPRAIDRSGHSERAGAGRAPGRRVSPFVRRPRGPSRADNEVRHRCDARGERPAARTIREDGCDHACGRGASSRPVRRHIHHGGRRRRGTSRGSGRIWYARAVYSGTPLCDVASKRPGARGGSSREPKWVNISPAACSLKAAHDAGDADASSPIVGSAWDFSVTRPTAANCARHCGRFHWQSCHADWVQVGGRMQPEAAMRHLTRRAFEGGRGRSRRVSRDHGVIEVEPSVASQRAARAVPTRELFG